MEIKIYMRGLKKETETNTNDSILIIRRKRGIAMARIVDENDETIYRIVSTWWTKIYLTALILLVAVVVLLAANSFINSQRIDAVEKYQLEDRPGN